MSPDPNLYSGMLEVVESAFAEIAKQIDDYSAIIESKDSATSGAEIDAISLDKFIADARSKFGVDIRKRKQLNEEIVTELHQYGIDTISDLYKLITDDYLALFKEHKLRYGEIGFLRSLMMFADIDRYMSQVSRKWSFLSENSQTLLRAKYGNRFRDIMEANKIETPNRDRPRSKTT